MVDLAELAQTRRQDLLVEADRDRLAALLPATTSPVRRGLAVACHRLADWLDGAQDQATYAGGQIWHASCALAASDASSVSGVRTSG
jgi:hypothetical protein